MNRLSLSYTAQARHSAVKAKHRIQALPAGEAAADRCRAILRFVVPSWRAAVARPLEPHALAMAGGELFCIFTVTAAGSPVLTGHAAVARLATEPDGDFIEGYYKVPDDRMGDLLAEALQDYERGIEAPEPLVLRPARRVCCREDRLPAWLRRGHPFVKDQWRGAVSPASFSSASAGADSATASCCG